MVKTPDFIPVSLEIYLSYEFFFNLIPCYLFIFIGFCRYFSLYRSLRSSYEKALSDNDSDTISNDIEPAPALFIKKKLSYLMAFIFIFSIFLAFLTPKHLFWASNYPIESFSYLIGAIAWVLSGKLIQLEFEKEYYQEIYTHKLLCPLTLVISLCNLIVFWENHLIDTILHIIKALISGIMTIYVFYKPNDRIYMNSNGYFSELEGKHGDCYKILDIIEAFQCIQFLFHYKINKLPESIPLMDFSKKESDYSLKRADSLKINHNNINNKELPEKRIIHIESADCLYNSLESINSTYLITTIINEKTYLTRKRFDEIIDLTNFLKFVYNIKDFPQYYDIYPVFKEREDIKEIEEFFNALLAEPAFMHPRLLDFLRISQKKPFLDYFNQIVPKKSLDLWVLPKESRHSNGFIPFLRRNSENQDVFKETEENYLPISLKHINSIKMIDFEVNCSGWEKSKAENQYLFIFHLKCLFGNYSWVIKKCYSDVKEFNVNLGESLKRNIPLFNNFAPKKTANFANMDEKFLEERRKGLENYMKEVFKDKSFYDELLFGFIEYDYDSKMPLCVGKTENPLEYSNEMNQNNELLIETPHQVEFHSLKEENLIWIEENTGKRGIIKKNELCSPSFRNKRKIVADINFNHVRIGFNGIKKTLIENLQNYPISNQNLMKKTQSKGRIERNYFFNLEEYEGYGCNNIRTVIKLSKNYKELEEFHKIIKKNFENEYLIDLPEDVKEEGSLPNKESLKKLWEDYFVHLLMIPTVEENQTLKEFFHLDKARNRYMNDSERKETFKLDLTYF